LIFGKNAKNTPSNSLANDLTIFCNLGKTCLQGAKIHAHTPFGILVSLVDEAKVGGWKRIKEYKRVPDVNV
jgi:hypothetical protein